VKLIVKVSLEVFQRFRVDATLTFVWLFFVCGVFSFVLTFRVLFSIGIEGLIELDIFPQILKVFL
jgi:hypothetical protein